MKYRELARLLKDANFAPRPGKGDHEVWRHPSGISATVVRDAECSPAVTRNALKAIEQTKEAER
ncbi:MAG: type II toxin-antitoxin system HicA family toxin [Propionibacteriaceae bacterium]|nr:type II toxin-antitoxin system HicA family toxin [Propionibacteriaceae bacterium]